MQLRKYHALGNDYLVLDGAVSEPAPELVRRLCHRHFGPGGDGVLWGPRPAADALGGLRIFNPDGSEAEKSGNGLRIFARYLLDQGHVGAGAPFVLATKGGLVRAEVAAGGRSVRVEMGRASFRRDAVPVNLPGPDREILEVPLTVGGEAVAFSAATVGNPHCVIRVSAATPELALRLGPLLEVHPLFPHRTNVQFVQVLGPARLRIEIWERGAGYTLASGSSSCACAAVARRLGWTGGDVTVEMPGGELQIRVADDFALEMTGPVTRVADLEVHPEALE